MMNKMLSAKTKKGCLVMFGVILIATALIVSSSLTFAASTSVTASSNGTDMYPAPPAKVAASDTQFNLDIVYAYVGPAPSDTSYFDEKFNTTMYLAYQYPSKVLLNITRVPGVKIASCDAEVEVYGIRIVADTGTTEYYTYSAGTNYDSSFSYSNESALILHVHNLVDHNLYDGIIGNFDFNWTANTSIMSQTIGSIGWYTNIPSADAGLYRAGTPGTISITVSRIGYVTMSNGSVSIYEDAPTDNAIASVLLRNYKDGFLYNRLVPASELPQTDLFYPITNP
jgi:hypothetical protein